MPDYPSISSTSFSKSFGAVIGYRLALSMEQTGFESPVALYTQDGESAVLACLCHSEKNGPENALGSCADGQQHLCKRKDVARYATGKHYHAGAER